VKALIYHAYDDIRLEEQPVPAITDHELLVRVHGCGLCGSDIIKIAQQSPPPVILGHELTGTVIECGRAVSQFVPGQRIIVAHHVPCGTCHYCVHGNVSMCAAFKVSNIDPCGLAEYIRVPAAHVQAVTLSLPDTLSAEEGSFTEPLACCVRAVRRTPLQGGDAVMVMGLGTIGLLMLQAVKALGAALGGVSVYGVDQLPERLQLALDLGADAVFQAPEDAQVLRELLAVRTDGRGADSVIITAAGAQPLLQAMASVRRGGTMNIFAAHSGPVPIDIAALYHQELSITSTYSSSPEDLRLALDLLASRKVRVDQLISHRLPLEQFHEGVRLMLDRAALKVYFDIAGDSHGEFTV
jgi:L-iditol 2-dehydrogenase